MVKSSKFSRRQRTIAGRSVSSHVVYRMPKMPRSVDPLRPEVELRLRCVQHALTASPKDAASLFDRSLATVYRWITAYKAFGVRGLKAKSTRPGPRGRSSGVYELRRPCYDCVTSTGGQAKPSYACSCWRKA